MNKKKIYEEMREKRNHEILDCAQKKFMEHGIGNITMKAIASELKITRATLYKYFNSIEEIANELEYRSIANFTQYLRENSSSEGTGIQKISRMIEVFEKFVDEHSEDIMFTAMYDTYFGNSVTDEKVQGKIEEEIHSFIVFHDLIDEGKIDGTIKKDIDSDLLNVTIANLLVSIMQRMTLRGEVIKREQYVENTNKIYETINKMIISYIKA